MQGSQQIVITDKGKVEIDLVKAVRAFDEDGVVLDTGLGFIGIDGSNLRIEDLCKSSSKIMITGEIEGVYSFKNSDKKKGRIASK